LKLNVLVCVQVFTIEMALFCKLRVNLKGRFVVLKMYVRKKYAGLLAAMFWAIMIMVLTASMCLTC